MDANARDRLSVPVSVYLDSILSQLYSTPSLPCLDSTLPQLDSTSPPSGPQIKFFLLLTALIPYPTPTRHLSAKSPSTSPTWPPRCPLPLRPHLFFFKMDDTDMRSPSPGPAAPSPPSSSLSLSSPQRPRVCLPCPLPPQPPQQRPAKRRRENDDPPQYCHLPPAPAAAPPPPAPQPYSHYSQSRQVSLPAREPARPQKRPRLLPPPPAPPLAVAFPLTPAQLLRKEELYALIQQNREAIRAKKEEKRALRWEMELALQRLDGEIRGGNEELKGLLKELRSLDRR
ncbi:hypothetical protein AJ79_02524 [Helicocarpus griseus UAMH5409]|uniref:Uncharacterized protein n=1 Tax=Helicocarpus griseus UAMH5409 TaxID=1447875 RepID=A0A2B7Y1Z6_9EURO|nr:hypothetical protein AJ79_02524 [Helicocarpus griseus UAMH5409]